MKRFLMALAGLIVGYFASCAIGYGAIEEFSGNSFDRSVEAVTTAAFAIGPAGAIFGFFLGLVLGR